MKEKSPFAFLLNLLFPPKCVICDKLIPWEEIICPECARKLETTGSQACQEDSRFGVCYSPFYYREPLRASFLRYKFSGQRSHAPVYARWMADCLVAQNAADFDFITWAPLSVRRRLHRGFDQAELLAREIGKRLHIPVKGTLRKAHRPALSGLPGDAAVRRAKVLGAYSLKKKAKVGQKRILLVDDIITTGSTLGECARVLRDAGAAQITCVTLARR